MTYRIIGNDRPRGVAWAKDRFPHIQQGEDWSKASALILERDGNITAVVLYNEYRGSSVEASIALKPGSRLNRAFLRAMFAAPFIEWGVRRVTLRIASDNAKSIHFAKHLGFTLEGVIREGISQEVDVLILGMLRNECRFLDEQGISARRPRSNRDRSGTDAIQHCDGQ